MLYILWLFSSLWAPWLVNKISCIFKMISLLNIGFTVLFIVMGTKQWIFFLIKVFCFSPFVLCTLCCQFLWIVFFISLYWRSDNLYFIVLEEWQFLFHCIGGVTIFISLYRRSDNFYFIVLEEWQFSFNCIGGVTIFI